MSSSVQHTLFGYLTTRNPDLYYFETEGRKIRKSTQNPQYYIATEIKQWDELNYSTLQSIWDGLLSQTLNSRDQVGYSTDSSAIPKSFTAIHNKDSLDNLLAVWTRSVV